MARSALAALFAATLATPAFAQAVEDLDRLDRRVEILTGASIGQPGGAITPIDRRLRLAACPEPASIEPAGPDTLAIRCASLGWRLRVGMVSQASAQRTAELSVHRGDTVEVTITGEAFDVTASAIALDDGAEGASVRLKLAGTGTQSSAIVTGPGAVTFSR